ncbi:NAD(P)/FAD-dependent oxidoreductase [Kitasatospora sp. NPDC047058]|uniref:FAD-dependent oxidoreductase n=1 Tax=Kitasatospora sp. NPDC047058 TaxID=3155620 RepID=UPI0033D7D5DC
MNSTRPHSTGAPRVAVVGAGLGGLALAAVLHRHGHPVTVFEREDSPTARGQGGTLDIRAGSGQVALRAAGLLDRFHALARPEGQEWRLLDPLTGAARPAAGPDHDGEVPDLDEESPEIDRGQLRALFLDALPGGTVRWGHGVGGVTPPGDGTWRLRLADGTTEDADLVVGADGTWSRVRPALSDATPVYTGVTFVETGFDHCDLRHPGLARLVGPGTMLARCDGRAMVAQRNSDGHIRGYAALRVPEDWHRVDGPDDQSAIRARLLTAFDGWDEQLRYVLRHNDRPFVHRPLYALPAPHTWEHAPGVTLLGDAAHLLPPVGLGANLALLDGADLAHALLSEPTVDDAVRAYEAVMLPRSTRAALDCVGALDGLVPPAATPAAPAGTGVLTP